MSAAPDPMRPRLRPMRDADIPRVIEIERGAYGFPWSEGIFRDCLRVGYCCWVLVQARQIAGYGIMQVVADEAHVLNLCIERESQGQGFGRAMLRGLMDVARDHGARQVYLEVRPSNDVAIGLYQSEAFKTVGMRRGYYPSTPGREDAFILSREL
jgi:ribosomal-protein-alanine N-acetyltransferase